MATDEPHLDANIPPTLLGPLPPEVQEAALRPDSRCGRYVILSPLGHGAMGAVYRAWDPSLSRVVAVKRLHFELDDTLRERFLREGRAAARLRHPGIVAVHDVGEHDGKLFLAMDLLPGETLAGRFDRGGTDGLRERIRLLHGIAEAIGFAHAQGIVHRDVKPENVLVSADGRPVVTDFGLAKDLSKVGGATLTETGALLGTPQYMSPEQAAGRAVIGPASDVFSLGVVLYQALTGRRPFEGLGLSEILRKVQEHDPDPPRRLDPTIPRDLESVCTKALEKDPARRYADGRAIAEDLARWLAGDPVMARPVSLTRKMVRGVQRRRVAALVGLASVLLLVAAVSVHLGRRSAARSEAASAVVRAGDAVGRARNARKVGNSELMASAASDAEREATHAIETDPNTVGGWLERGRLYALLGRLDAARADLDRAVRLLPRDPISRAERGTVLARMYRTRVSLAQPGAIIERPAALDDREVEAADPDLRTLREAAEADLVAASAGHVPGAELGLLRAYLCFVRGDWPGTTAAADAVLRAEPSEEARLLRGLAMLREAQAVPERMVESLPPAIAELDEAVRAGQGYGEAVLARAEGRLRLIDARWSEHEEDVRAEIPATIEEARRAQKLGADAALASALEAQALWIWGEVLLKRVDEAKGNASEAVGRYRSAIDLLEGPAARSQDVPGLYLRGKIWNRYAVALKAAKEDPREAARTAVSRLEELVRLRPAYAHGHTKLGHCLMDLGGYEGLYGDPWVETFRRAIAVYTRGLDLGDDDEWAVVYRGEAHYEIAMDEREQGQDARAELERALPDLEAGAQSLPDESLPRGGIAHVELAKCLIERGEPPGNHLDRAEELLRAYLDDQRRYGFEEFDYATAVFWKGAVEEAAGRPCADLYRRALEHYALQPERPDRTDDGWLGVALGEAAVARAARATPDPEGLRRAYAALSRWCAEPDDEVIELGESFLSQPFAEGLLGLPDATQGGLMDLARFVGRALARPRVAARPGRLVDLAFVALGRAKALGALDRDALRDDPMLAPIHADPRWAAILAE